MSDGVDISSLARKSVSEGTRVAFVERAIDILWIVGVASLPQSLPRQAEFETPNRLIRRLFDLWPTFARDHGESTLTALRTTLAQLDDWLELANEQDIDVRRLDLLWTWVDGLFAAVDYFSTRRIECLEKVWEPLASEISDAYKYTTHDLPLALPHSPETTRLVHSRMILNVFHSLSTSESPISMSSLDAMILRTFPDVLSILVSRGILCTILRNKGRLLSHLVVKAVKPTHPTDAMLSTPITVLASLAEVLHGVRPIPGQDPGVRVVFLFDRTDAKESVPQLLEGRILTHVHREDGLGIRSLADGLDLLRGAVQRCERWAQEHGIAPALPSATAALARAERSLEIWMPEYEVTPDGVVVPRWTAEH
ncbi:MAG: hypothetical protein ACKVVT_04075 [Dehalococcoidia bacterium]